MFEFFRLLFDTSDFPARWHCGNWSTAHGLVHVVSDTLIFGAYAAIPTAIAFVALRRRESVVFPKLYWLFAAFIFSCGFGHLVEASIFWQPWYRFSGSVKIITAVASWATVIALVRYIPLALTLPGIADLNRALQREIGERRRAEEEVRRLNHDLSIRVQELETLLEVLPIGIGIAVDPECRTIRTNRAFAEMLGLSKEANASLTAENGDAPKGFKVLVQGEEVAPEDLPIQRAARQQEVIRNLEEVIVRADGRRIDLLCQAAPILDETHVCRGAVGVFHDITERKAAEERLKASLVEKQVLLHEIHHRVKNNLQFIVSLLRLQRAEMEDPQSREALEEARSRVQAMALVHEKLYRADDFSELDYGVYLRDLVAAVARTMSKRPERVELVVAADPRGLATKEAVPVGFIVNELVSNSLKHAFVDGQEGRVEVQLHGSPDAGYDLSVSDNGQGAHGSFQPETTRSMGWRLVEMLVRQLEGTIKMENGRGTKFAIHFPPAQNR